MDKFDPLEFLFAVRGVPTACDWCGDEFSDGDIFHPEEAGEWICDGCHVRDMEAQRTRPK